MISNKFIYTLIVSIFVISAWFVGYTFFSQSFLNNKKEALIQDIYNVIGTDTLYEYESMEDRNSSGSFLSYKYRNANHELFGEEIGYSHFYLKYDGEKDGFYKYQIVDWPWLIEKMKLTANGDYENYRIYPITIYIENKLDKLQIDSILINSYNYYTNNYCQANINESNSNYYQHYDDVKNIVEKNTTFILEKPKNNIPDAEIVSLHLGSHIVDISITKNTSYLKPKPDINKTQKTIQYIGCFIALLLLIVFFTVINKCNKFYSSKTSKIINIILVLITTLLWLWYYQSVISIEMDEEIKAQERLNIMFDDDVDRIFPTIKEAVEKSNIFKLSEINVVENVQSSFGYKYDIEENLNRLYNNPISLAYKIKAESLSSMIINCQLRTSKNTDAERIKIYNEIREIGWTIHSLLKTTPDEIEDVEDGKKYIHECDSIRRQVTYLLGVLEGDIQNLKKKIGR